MIAELRVENSSLESPKPTANERMTWTTPELRVLEITNETNAKGTTVVEGVTTKTS